MPVTITQDIPNTFQILYAADLPTNPNDVLPNCVAGTAPLQINLPNLCQVIPPQTQANYTIICTPKLANAPNGTAYYPEEDQSASNCGNTNVNAHGCYQTDLRTFSVASYLTPSNNPTTLNVCGQTTHVYAGTPYMSRLYVSCIVYCNPT